MALCTHLGLVVEGSSRISQRLDEGVAVKQMEAGFVDCIMQVCITPDDALIVQNILVKCTSLFVEFCF